MSPFRNKLQKLLDNGMPQNCYLCKAELTTDRYNGKTRCGYRPMLNLPNNITPDQAVDCQGFQLKEEDKLSKDKEVAEIIKNHSI